ncbi:GNAT family N-acetyltransferase [Rubrolithibacter danxiaensis]|uniref:GNAT family N-acetyltransferase n=1 Tax=Rubrolithibacter danxiaensis TaxID=3390805 RepID=UPI003BF89165
MIIKEINKEDTWLIRQKVMWPDKPIDFVKISDDNAGLHYGLFVDGVLTSVVSCFEAGTDMQFRKLATLTDKQGKGYGTHLLKYILDVAGNKGMKRLWCNARVNKKSFYEKFGLINTGNTFVKEGIEFSVMELYLSDNH